MSDREEKLTVRSYLLLIVFSAIMLFIVLLCYHEYEVRYARNMLHDAFHVLFPKN
jgi:hypothetical protein